MAKLEISNVVAKGQLNTKLYLPEVAELLMACEYNSRRFAAATYRVACPYATILLFGSGKWVISGAKSELHAAQAIWYLVLQLQMRVFSTQSSVIVRNETFYVENLNSTLYIFNEINLTELANKNSSICTYEAGIFPAAIVRSSQNIGDLVCLIFSTGKIVITGAKSSTMSHMAARWLLNGPLNLGSICNDVKESRPI